MDLMARNFAEGRQHREMQRRDREMQRRDIPHLWVDADRDGRPIVREINMQRGVLQDESESENENNSNYQINDSLTVDEVRNDYLHHHHQKWLLLIRMKLKKNC